MKKRQKSRQKEAEKAKKAASAPAQPTKKKATSAEEDEAHLNPNVRISTLQKKKRNLPSANVQLT